MVPNVKPIMTDVQSTGDNNITITFQVSYKTSAVRYRSKVRINFHRIVFIAKSVRLILSHRLYMWPCINPLKLATNYFDDYVPQLSWFQILIIVAEKNIIAKYINSKPWATT